MDAQSATVLVIGGGGRESAICRKLLADGVGKIYCSPGNPGTALMGCINVDLELKAPGTILLFVRQKGIDLTIVGPEEYLAQGIVDAFEAAGRLIIGPTKAAAQLESSKIFARELMAACKILQPKFLVCSSPFEANAAKIHFGFPVVIKIDGLAAGKGVFVCHNEEDWLNAMELIFVRNKFGETRVLVEECLKGQEMSLFAVCDQSWWRHRILGTAQDYKRLLNDNLGPNTGGMGAISPAPAATREIISQINDKVIMPILDAMEHRGMPYKGILYVGVMIVDQKPYVLEFNARLGDPETQVILPTMSTSLFDLFYKAACDRLDEADSIMHYHLHAVTVVKVAQGYPGNCIKGDVIGDLSVDSNIPLAHILHAGTSFKEQTIVSSGGRVLNIVAAGNNLTAAIKNVYQLCSPVHFDHEFYRADIGAGTEVRNL